MVFPLCVGVFADLRFAPGPMRLGSSAAFSFDVLLLVAHGGQMPFDLEMKGVP